MVVSKSFAVEPSKTKVPLTSFIEFAASAEPDIKVVPTSVVEVKEDNPAIVVAVPPKDTEVLPIVNEELAKLLLAIDDASVSIVPVSLGNVSVLSLPVAFAAVSTVSYTHLTLPTNREV